MPKNKCGSVIMKECDVEKFIELYNFMCSFSDNQEWHRKVWFKLKEVFQKKQSN